MQDLRISLVQGATRWHDPDANREYYSELINPLANATDLVILPETFTSGFSNEALMMLKTAVLAPMPSASDSTATMVKAGLFIKIRKPKRMSCHRVFTISPFED